MRLTHKAPPDETDGDTRLGLRFTLAGEAMEALAEGALWIVGSRMLVVSDMHLEKGSAYARRGQLLPPYDTRTTLQRLDALMQRVAPDAVIALGDSFHDREAEHRMHEEDAALLHSLVARADWIWIEGNHDPQPSPALGGRVAGELRLGALTLRHEPRPGATGEIAGHLHPCAKVSARGRAVRARCFAADASRLVMPAFGAYAGGLNVKDDAFAPLFPKGCTALMLGRERVYAAPASRQVGDGDAR